MIDVNQVDIEAARKAKIIDGKAVAAKTKNDLKDACETLLRDHNVVPGLAVILVGERVDSATYVRLKKKSANELGFYSIDIALAEDVTQERLIDEIKALNNNDKIHGILLQLPLPEHINEHAALSTIAVHKDVDCFQAENIGNMCLRGGVPPLALPCTPAGCIELLQHYNVNLEGKDVVVLGRSNIVGMPIAHILLSCDATVTICHSQTSSLHEKIKHADILIVAVGKPEFVRGEWIKEGAVVIDVGINCVDDSTRKRGYRLVGDVNFEEAIDKVSLISPVPGGVGPMTIAMLMRNTINLARHSVNLDRIPLRRREHKNS